MNKILFNPFEKHAPEKLVYIGTVFLLVGSLLASLTHIRFDGVLDIHVYPAVSYPQAIMDLLVSAIIMSAIFYMIGRLVLNRKTRLIDILSPILISRIPIYLVSLLNIGNPLQAVENPEDLEAIMTFAQENLALLTVFGLFSILFTVWSIALLVNGFKIATNTKGASLVLSIVIGLIISEVASKLIISMY